MQSGTPTAVPGLDRVGGIAGGRYAGAAVREDGTVWMWGSDKDGVMGTGKLTGPYESARAYLQPRRVEGITDVVQIAAGYNHVLALRKDGTVWSWGFNKFGQLGVGDTEDRGVPAQVRGLTGVTRIYAVGNMSAARLAGGSWRLWGWAGPVGVGTTENFRPALEPKPLPAHLRTTVDLGGAVFLLRDGSVWTWGDNSFGTLGTGGDTGDFSTSGVQLKQLTGIVRVWSDGNRTLALKNDGTLYLWGPRFVGVRSLPIVAVAGAKSTATTDAARQSEAGHRVVTSFRRARLSSASRDSIGRQRGSPRICLIRGFVS